MIEEFAGARGLVVSEFLDLNHISKTYVSSVPCDCEVHSGLWRQVLANFAIGTLV
jgi:hypothetical protein